MNFLISDTFTSSLARLNNDEQKVVKTTVFDLQLDPASPGMHFHRIDRSKDSNFWSIRVSGDLRIIIHKTEANFLVCYVDHHDKAYQWAERRKIEQHPKTGATQLVEIRESVKEIIVPKYIEQPTRDDPRAKPIVKPERLFARLTEGEILELGVPADWVQDVLNADEDALFLIAPHLPQEAAEALLELAVGGTPKVKGPIKDSKEGFEHPDAQRRFSKIRTSEELERALNFPWDKWTIFLHPDQREIVSKNFNGPARVSGSAGTGKTIVALHRAVHLAKDNESARVLVTTFSEPLANALSARLKRLISNEPRLGDRIEVHAIRSVGLKLYQKIPGAKAVLPRHELLEVLKSVYLKQPDKRLSFNFIASEWFDVIDAWGIQDADSYKDAKRLGRRRRVSEAQRDLIWKVFSTVQSVLAERGSVTEGAMYRAITEQVQGFKNSPYDFVVVDESQDLNPPQLQFLAAIGANRPNSLFFAGDLGQRIFQQPFSWKSVGVEIRGRSKTLKVNYRTSHQIRSHADRLLGPEVSDVDGNAESRKYTVSAFDGTPPNISFFDSEETENNTVADWIKGLLDTGFNPGEIGVFVRNEEVISRAVDAVKSAGQAHLVLDDGNQPVSTKISVGTMHLAKGLEFRAVCVMACDDEVVPLQTRIESAADESDLEEIYETERHLLYVACTRARDQLLVTGVAPGSEFLEDMNGEKWVGR